MLTTKRRGRPVGTDYKEDSEALALVADRLIADEDLTPWPAMKEVCKLRKWRGSTDEAIVARWLRKWKTQGEVELASALQRSTSRRTSPVVLTMDVAMGELSARIGHFSAELIAAAEPTRRAMEQVARALVADNGTWIETCAGVAKA